MGNNLSKTQIDRLGDRLRKGDITEADLRMLDEYRRSFSEAYEFVVGAVRNELGLEPTGRPAKSTTSISEKLRRESIRLTQIQDIAGCRLVVGDILAQDQIVESLKELFASAVVVDRRDYPSNGYRAVHVIVKISDILVEVQVRTTLQHAWAELSEKLSDVINPAIKYGGGNPSEQQRLKEYSDLVAQNETLELDLAKARTAMSKWLSLDSLSNDQRAKLAEAQNLIEQSGRTFDVIRDGLLRILKKTIDSLPK